MRRVWLSMFVVALLAGPLSSVSHAGIVCDLQEKLGVNNVKDCEDYWP